MENKTQASPSSAKKGQTGTDPETTMTGSTGTNTGMNAGSDGMTSSSDNTGNNGQNKGQKGQNKSLKQMFEQELRDIYSAETQLVEALPKMALS